MEELRLETSYAEISEAINNPAKDPYTFIKAEEFFEDKTSFHRPFKVTEYVRTDGTFDEVVTSGAVFRFNDQTLLLVQFIRPKVWRFRFDANVRNPSEFKDFNSYAMLFLLKFYRLTFS